MKNFKKVIVLSLTVAIGLGSLAYASDFPTSKGAGENEVYSHCYGRNDSKERHHKMRHHRGKENHRIKDREKRHRR